METSHNVATPRSSLAKARTGNAINRFLEAKAVAHESEHAAAVSRLDWHQRRPLRAGNWAVPPSASDKRDISRWESREIESYMIKFGASVYSRERALAFAEKVKYISRSTKIDLHVPMIACVVKSEVNNAVAALSCHRSQRQQGPCIVKKPEDCSFVIPNYGLRDLMQRVSSAQDSHNTFERLSKLNKTAARHATSGSRQLGPRSDVHEEPRVKTSAD